MATDRENLSLQSTEPLSLDTLIGYGLKRAYMAVREDFRRAMGDEDLSPRVFSALAIVVQYPNITEGEVARMLAVDHAGMVAIADDLEQRGYLRRTSSPEDLQVEALLPRAKGRAAYARALRKVVDHEARFFTHLSAAERDTLLALLHKIRAGETQAPG